MTSLLRQRHHLQWNEDDDFTIRNMEEVFRAQENSARIMSILLAAIASVSLIVGGIGIMNIMLVSVTERTKEIGLRQAVGAKTTDILGQFLAEAVTLSLTGGAAGVATGIAVSILISYFARWSTVVSITAILVAFLFSGLVGIVLRLLPGAQGRVHGPDRSFALRMNALSREHLESKKALCVAVRDPLAVGGAHRQLIQECARLRHRSVGIVGREHNPIDAYLKQ